MDTTAHTPRMDHKHEEPAAWAVRLVQRQHPAPAGTHSIGDAALTTAIEALWALFDTSLAEANAAFEQSGEPGCISVLRSPHERQYWAIGPDGMQRVISIFLTIPMAGGHVRTSAYIGSNQSRLSLYLVPTDDGRNVRWVVATSGREFTSDLVHDLFLGVFSDDPAAVRRLTPLSESDLVQAAWS